MLFGEKNGNLRVIKTASFSLQESKSTKQVCEKVAV